MFKSGNVTVMVSNMDPAVKFYTETLGMKLKYPASPDWAEVAMAELTVGLHTAGEHGPRPGTAGSLSIGLAVDDLDKAMADLKARGVKFGPHVMEDGPVRLAFFTDPDQNALYLWQMKPQDPATQAALHGTHAAHSKS